MRIFLLVESLLQHTNATCLHRWNEEYTDESLYGRFLKAGTGVHVVQA